MSAAAANKRAELASAAQAQGLLPPGAQIHERNADGHSWPLIALSFLGAQLVVLPFLAVLLLSSFEFFFEGSGAWLIAAVLLASGTAGLRRTSGVFTTQIAFSALLTGLAALVVALVVAVDGDVFGWLQTSVLLAVLIVVALVVRVVWVQQVLGFLAAAVALLLGLFLQGDFFHLRAYPSDLALVALTALWVLWATREPQWSARVWAQRVSALADGASVALLLSTLFATGQQVFAAYAFGQNATGSADSPIAGLARILAFNWPTAIQLALVVCAAAWLWVHWQLGSPNRKRERQLLALVFAVLAIACWVVPLMGVVALVATVALGTGRGQLLGLAAFTLLVQLSGFYYALQWPLTHKAALLAATGAALAVALGALWALRQRRPAEAAQSASATGARRWAAPVLMALAGAVAVGLVHRDVQNKEQVIAQGQKIYLQLVPRDPRSLMQGDYMALNFEIPEAVRDQLQKQGERGLSHNALVVAQLDERGVAKVLRLAQDNEPMAAQEIRLPLKLLKDEWTMVTDAYFFPEGQGEPFKQARFGEFRALPDGRALLVGLADEALQPIAPSRAAAAVD